ncbi:MAG: family 10 glycosylhydrolase [Theionarchaea archaeon]|nr:family 10 glycosylhydrolase [Theionarchaea archaeon]
MKKTAVILVIILLGCINQVEERPELKITASTEQFSQGKTSLEVLITNTGKTGLHNVVIRVDLPGDFTCRMSEYFVDVIEPGADRVFHFEIISHAPEGEYTLHIFMESDELVLERKFTFSVVSEKVEKNLEDEKEKEEEKEIPEPTYERIFGAQYDTDDLYNADIDALMQQLTQAGINTVVFRVFDYEYEPLSDCGVYFETDHAPVKKDLLKEVVEKAHKEGIQVFAWMTTLDCPWILADHPEWGVVAYNWEKQKYITNASWWLRISPFNNQHREYLKKLYADLAQYDIEGIVFQDDLYLEDNEDFSSYAEESYKKEFERGLSIHNMFDEYDNLTPEGEQWVDWKCKALMDMCKEIMDAVHEVNPDCKFLIDMFYEGVYNPEDCRRWFAQDAELAIQSGFDYLYVMSYHHFMAGELDLTIEEAIDLLGEMTKRGINLVGAERLIMKIQVYDWFTETPVENWEIEKAYTVLVEAGCLHIAYTPHHDRVPFTLIRRFAPQSGRFYMV